MRIFFDSRITGSTSDFVWHDGEIETGSDSNCDWFLRPKGARKGCVLAASEAAGEQIMLSPDVPQAKFWKKHTDNPAWSRILSKKEYAGFLKQAVESTVEFLTKEQTRYFLTCFQVQQGLLDKLVPGRVANEDLVAHDFIPDERGFVRVPEYDNVHSATGRMSIVSGPKILTLQKDLRRNIVSRWDDGELVEVDFNALEARVLAWISGLDVGQGDTYEWISSRSGAESVGRGVIKEATLAAIYGMSQRNFALRYQDIPDAISVYQSVRDLLKVSELDHKLKSMGTFANAFGRPLGDSNARISHHVQSSAVDVACHGFSWLLDEVDLNMAKPVYLIHDALVIDIKKSYLPHFENACKDGLFVKIIDQFLPVKTRRFNGA